MNYGTSKTIYLKIRPQSHEKNYSGFSKSGHIWPGYALAKCGCHQPQGGSVIEIGLVLRLDHLHHAEYRSLLPHSQRLMSTFAMLSKD